MGLMFSDEDSDLGDLKWTISKGYAVRRNGGQHVPLMKAHRTVIERVVGRPLLKGEIVDHINGDRLDNRRSNLRITDAAGNAQNVTKTWGAAGARGVIFRKNRWEAYVQSQGRRHYCGRYTSRDEAAAAARDKRSELGFLSEQF